MKKILFGIYIMGVMILIMTLLEFIYLDKKLTRAIYKQMEINARVSTTLETQAKHIRVLNTDCLVLTNIITSGEYLGNQAEDEE